MVQLHLRISLRAARYVIAAITRDMKVSICIPTYNQAQFLKTAVVSAINQVHIETDIWVSDDASTDETPKIVADLREEYPHLITKRHAKNLGMGGNPNWLFRQPDSDFLVKLDSDDSLEPLFCAQLLHLLTQYPKAAYAHGNINQIDENGNITRVRRLSRRKEYIDADQSLVDSASGYRVSANIIMFRRQALEQVDFWRADMAFADDWDLAVRLADAGWGNVYCSDVVASYRVWSDPRGYREGRKMAELEGIRRVFIDSLVPAFKRRGWDLKPLSQHRKRFAFGQATALLRVPMDAPEFHLIRSALSALGNSTILHVSFWLIDHKLGFFLQIFANVRLWMFDTLKKLNLCLNG